MNKANADQVASPFRIKMLLRRRGLPAGIGPVRVLDCFGRLGRVWDAVRRRVPDRQIAVAQIDHYLDQSDAELAGDNRRHLARLDLDAYDVIDLESRGVPYDQLEILFMRRPSRPKTVFVSFCPCDTGLLSENMLVDLGYTTGMIAKCPDLFSRRPMEKLKAYLSIRGVTEIVRWGGGGDREHFYFEYPGS